MFTLNPIHHHCGPGNDILPEDSDNPVDKSCRKHDLSYNEIGYPHAYTHFSDADSTFIKEMNAMPGVLPIFYGGVFKFKKLIAPTLTNKPVSKQVSFQMTNAGSVNVTPSRGRKRIRTSYKAPATPRKSKSRSKSRGGSRKRKTPGRRKRATARKSVRSSRPRGHGYTGPVVNKSGPSRVYAVAKPPRDPKFWAKWKQCAAKAEIEFFSWGFWVDTQSIDGNSSTIGTAPERNGYIPIDEKRMTIFHHWFCTFAQFANIIRGGEDNTVNPKRPSIWASPNLVVYAASDAAVVGSAPFTQNNKELFLFKELSLTYRFTNTGKLPLAITIIDFLCKEDTVSNWQAEFWAEYKAQQVFTLTGTVPNTPFVQVPTHYEFFRSIGLLKHIKGTKSWGIARRQEILLNNEDPDILWHVSANHTFYDQQDIGDNLAPNGYQFDYLKKKTIQTVWFVNGVLGRTTSVIAPNTDTAATAVKATSLTGGEMNVMATFHVKGARYALTGKQPKSVVFDDPSIYRITHAATNNTGRFEDMSSTSRSVATYEHDEALTVGIP